MCYRCGLCQAVVPPRQPRRVHVVTREAPQRSPFARTPYRTEIAREIPVCGSCQSALAKGASVEQLVRARGAAPSRERNGQGQSRGAKRPETRQTPVQTQPVLRPGLSALFGE